MSNVNAEIKFQGNNDAWFTSNAAVVFADNIIIYHNDGRYKFADGVTALSALPFLGSSGGGSQNLQQVLAIDNKTGEHSITSDDGLSVLEVVNGYIYMYTGSSNRGEIYLAVSEARLYNEVGGFFASEGIISYFTNNYVQVKSTKVEVKHLTLIELNAPSVTKNGLEIATVNQITGINSGTNTGDETTATIQTKRPLKTIEGQSLEGSGNIDLVKADVGLSNADNTSDINKPVSTAQAAADTAVLNSANNYTDSSIVTLKDGVSGSGDTLQKLYNLIIGSFTEVTVANIAARNAYNVTLGYHIFVSDDGDGNWALYKATSSGVNATYIKLSDPDLLNAVMSASQIKSSYESNADTNAFTNALLTKLNGIATGATANSSDATLLARINHTGTQLSNTISDFATTVRATVLTGLSNATSQVISATDTVLQAFGYLQAQITANIAILATKRNFSRTTFGNVDYNVSVTDDYVTTSAALTLPRTVTLDGTRAANRDIVIADDLGTITSVNTLTIAVQSGKYLNGVLNGTEVMSAAYSQRRLFPDGSGNWSFDKGIVRLGQTQTLSNKTLDSTNVGVTQGANDNSTKLATTAYADLKLAIANNLSDLANFLTARNNLKFWDLFIASGDQTTTSSTAVNITDLVSGTLLANKRYKISGIIQVGCNNTGGVKLAVTFPAGSTVKINLFGFTSSATAFILSNLNAGSTISSAFCTIASSGGCVAISGEITVGSTAGVLQWLFAAGVSGQTASVYQVGTQLTVTQIN